MGTEIAAALWHTVVELTVCVSQLFNHYKITSTAPSHGPRSSNPRPSVTVLTHELDGKINFTTHGCPGHEVAVYALKVKWR